MFRIGAYQGPTRVCSFEANAVWYVKVNIAAEPGAKMAGKAGLGYGDSFMLDTIGRPQARAGYFTIGWITADVPKKELTGKRESRVAMAPPETREQMARLYRAR